MRHFCKLSDSDVERAWHGREDELHLEESRSSPAEIQQLLELDLDILGLLSPKWSCTAVVSPPKVPQGCWENFWKVFETTSRRVLWKCKFYYQKTFSFTNGCIGLNISFFHFLLLFHGKHSCHTPFCILPQHDSSVMSGKT